MSLKAWLKVQVLINKGSKITCSRQIEFSAKQHQISVSKDNFFFSKFIINMITVNSNRTASHRLRWITVFPKFFHCKLPIQSRQIFL